MFVNFTHIDIDRPSCIQALRSMVTTDLALQEADNVLMVQTRQLLQTEIFIIV